MSEHVEQARDPAGNPFSAREAATRAQHIALQATGSEEETALLLELAEVLGRSKPWVQSLALLGFAIGGVVLLVQLVFLLSDLEGTQNIAPEVRVLRFFGGLMVCGFYLGGASLLHRYARSLARFRERGQRIDFENALAAQLLFWRVIGILVALALVLYLALIVLGLLVVLLWVS